MSERGFTWVRQLKGMHDWKHFGESASMHFYRSCLKEKLPHSAEILSNFVKLYIQKLQPVQFKLTHKKRKKNICVAYAKEIHNPGWSWNIMFFQNLQIFSEFGGFLPNSGGT